VWFGGKMIYEGGSSVYEVGTAAGATYHDRVGTNRASGARFYPYGDQIRGTSNDHEKFATYQRDGFTGLDYADQRYYASAYGRFATADQYMASAGPSDPGSWNRYAYVGGDPVNHRDPRGQYSCNVDDAGCGFQTDPCYDASNEVGCYDDSGDGSDAGDGTDAGDDQNAPPPDCAVNGTTQLQINFIEAHWGAADATASTYSKSTSEVQTIAGAFILWSANETGVIH